MKTLRSAVSLLRVCWKPMFLFELIYKLFAAALFVPAFSLLFTGIMRLSGRRYLTAENIVSFLTHPVTLAGALLILIVTGMYIAVDLAVAVRILHQAAEGRPCGALYAVKTVLREWKRVLRPALIPMSLYIQLFSLFLHLGMIAGVLFTVRIPVFFAKYILKYPPALAGTIVFMLALGFMLLRLMYALPVFLLEKRPFAAACRQSLRLSRKSFFSDLGCFFAVQAALIALFLALSLFGILILRLISLRLTRAFLAGHLLTLLLGVLLFISILSVPALFSVILTLYRRHTAENGLPLPEADDIPPAPDPRRRRLLRSLSLLAVLVALAGCSLVIYRYQRGHYNLDIEYLRATEITAHRGASLQAPENTMAAFEAAWEQGADWIELDVRQSSDGAVFCLHDASLARVASVNKRAWELTWEELSRLDVGSVFGPDFAGERIPLLQDAIDFALQRGIRLNIELKPSIHDQGLEKAVADIILENGFEDQCVVTCQHYASLEKIKAYAPDLTTVYVMSMMYGNLAQLTAADHFSVAFSYVTRDMVSRSHRAGKQVYAWTVDRADVMQRMIDLGVDNIITNNVSLAVGAVSASAASDIVHTLVEEFIEPEAPSEINKQERQ